MEQQTISIAKAGVTTILNARASVLAAANPIYGRYDIRRSPAENINLPSSLLSRFDLLWLMLDNSDPHLDAQLAAHIIQVHTNQKPPNVQFPSEQDLPLRFECDGKVVDLSEPLAPDMIRFYITLTQVYRPSIPREITEDLAALYTGIRKEEVHDMKTSWITTPRTLLSIVRLSQ